MSRHRRKQTRPLRRWTLSNTNSENPLDQGLTTASGLQPEPARERLQASVSWVIATHSPYFIPSMMPGRNKNSVNENRFIYPSSYLCARTGGPFLSPHQTQFEELIKNEGLNKSGFSDSTLRDSDPAVLMMGPRK